MPTRFPRLTLKTSAPCRIAWAGRRAAICCLFLAVALLVMTPHVQGDASASALREDNIVSPGKAARDPHAFGPVEDLTGAVLADEVPARDATGQVHLVGFAGLMSKVPRGEVGAIADVEGRDTYATADLITAINADSGDSSRRSPVFWITLTSSVTLGLLSLYFLRKHRQQRDGHSRSETTDFVVATTDTVGFLEAAPARSRSPTKGTRLDSGFISGRSAVLGDTIPENKNDNMAEGDLVGTSNSTVLGQDELDALDLN